MKIIIDGLEIDIKAKGIYNKERYNKKDLFAFLNTLSILFSESAKYNEIIFKEPCEYRRNESDKLYEFLKEQGLYKGMN